MNELYILLLLPSLPICAWTLYKKIKEKKLIEAAIIGFSVFAILCNAFIVMKMMLDQATTFMRWWQMALSATIVPMSYVYFSQQIGKQFNNRTNIVLWLLLIFLAIPDCLIFWPGATPDTENVKILPLTIQFIQGSNTFLSLRTGDFIIIAQALVTLTRIYPMMKVLHEYGLKLDRKMYAFVLWWAMAILFITIVSVNDISVMRTTWGCVFYFASLSLLICSILMLIALDFDLNPVKTEEGMSVDNVISYVQEQSGLYAQVRHMIEEDKVYLRPGYRTEDALMTLATNRTYFTRMMHQRFGKTFSQLLNEKRLEHAKSMLLTSDLTFNDIAMQSGFSDAAHMSRVFKSVLDVTARQWQKANLPS